MMMHFQIEISLLVLDSFRLWALVCIFLFFLNLQDTHTENKRILLDECTHITTWAQGMVGVVELGKHMH